MWRGLIRLEIIIETLSLIENADVHFKIVVREPGLLRTFSRPNESCCCKGAIRLSTFSPQKGPTG
jgi:hypothetical protein